ncbi:MAG: hypothetical protein HRU17_18020 [Polyangiaceae bacterium]|nr:hypothetical protein [Polyangiaceae bacterium]
MRVETVKRTGSASNYVVIFFPVAKLDSVAWFAAPSLIYALERVGADGS